MSTSSNEYVYCPYDGARLERVTADPDDNAVGRCAQCGFVDYENPRPAVATFICDATRVLFSQRGVEPMKGKWDIPGGFIEAGESAEAAVVREAWEETNLKVRVMKFLGSLPDIYGDRKWPTLNLIYVVRRRAGKMKAQSDVAELKWFEVDSIPADLAFAHQKRAVDMLRAYLRKRGS